MSKITIEQLQAKLDKINDQLLPEAELDAALLLAALQSTVDDVAGGFASSDWCLFQGDGFSVSMIVSKNEDDQYLDEQEDILLLDEIDPKNHRGGH